MKALSFFLSLCFFCSYFSLLAQNFEVQLGPEYDDKAYGLPPNLVGFDGKYYYTFQDGNALSRPPIGPFSKPSYFLRKFDSNLNAKPAKKIILKSNGKSESPAFVVMLETNLYLFSVQYSQKDRTSELFVRQIDRTNLSFPAVGTSVARISYDGFPKYKYVGFDYEMSRDSSKLMIHYQLPSKEDMPEKFAIHLFNESMIPLWNQEFELPYEEELFSVRKFRVDNEANAYAFGREYFDKPKMRRKGEPNYQYKLLMLRPGFERPDEATLKMDGKFLVDMHMGILKNQEVVCAGVYAEDKPHLLKGVYTFTYDAAREKIVQESSQEMSLSLFSEGEEEEKPKKPLTARQQKKADKRAERELINYDFSNMVLRSDGGFMVIGELEYTRTHTYYVSDSRGGGSWRTTTTFHNDDILAMAVSPSGSIETATRIAKRQQSSSNNFLLSFALMVSGSNVHFIYNDHIENLGLQPGEEAKTYVPSLFGKGKQVVELVSLDPTGSYKRQALLSTKEVNQFAIPWAGVQTQPNEFILMFQKRKKRRLVRITLTD